MKKRQVFQEFFQSGVFAGFVLLALAALPGKAQVIFSNFSLTQGLAGSINVFCVAGSANTNCGSAVSGAIAIPFTTAQGTSTVGLPFRSISLPLGYNSGTNGVIISLAESSVSGPGSILESWTVTSLPTSYPPAITTVNDRLNLTLQYNTQYFIVVAPMAADTLAVWYNSPVSGAYVTVNSGSGWGPLTYAANGPAAIVSTTQQGALAHIAVNGGWTTQIAIVNPAPSPSSISVTVQLHDESGNALSLPITTTLNGVTQTLTTSTVTATLGGMDTLTISAGSQSGAIVVGSAQVVSSGLVNGYAIFRYNPSGGAPSEGTVPLQSQSPYSIIVPYDNTAGYVTGVALANLSPLAQTITLNIWNANGTQLPSPAPITLAGNGHTSFVLPTTYQSTLGIRGTMQFVSASGGLSAIGLRSTPTLTFTSVPMIITGPLAQ